MIAELPLRRIAPPAAPLETPGERLEFFLVALAVLLSPMNYLRIDAVYFTAADAVMLVAAVVMLANRRFTLTPFGPATPLWLGSTLLVSAGLMLGSMVNGDPVAGAAGVAQYIFSLVLVPLLLMNQPAQRVVQLMGVFVLAMVLVALHGAYYVNFHEGSSPFVSGNGRLRSLVERTNECASLLAMAIVFLLWLRFTRTLSMLAFALALPALCYGLLLTGSNTGLLLTIAGSLALAFLSGSARIGLILLLSGGALLVVTILWGELFLPDVFVRRVLGALQSGDLSEAGTFEGRLLLMREAERIGNDTILIGLGVDEYRTVSAYNNPVHNVYLLLLTEGGLMALLGLGGLLTSSIYIGWLAMNRRESRWGASLTLTVVVMFALCLTGIPHFYARFWAVPWILAMAAGLAGLRAQKGGSPRLRIA